MKSIQSPEGVALLMKNLWLRHKAGMQQRPCNVYLVELPPQTEEELAEATRKRTVSPMMNPKKCTEHGFNRYDI